MIICRVRREAFPVRPACGGVGAPAEEGRRMAAKGAAIEGEKAMLKAAKNGDAAGVRELLAGDASLKNTRDKDGSTPLHCAAWKGHAEVAALLLEAGADVNARSQNEHYGDTPLHAAAHGTSGWWRSCCSRGGRTRGQ